MWYHPWGWGCGGGGFVPGLVLGSALSAPSPQLPSRHPQHQQQQQQEEQQHEKPHQHTQGSGTSAFSPPAYYTAPLPTGPVRPPPPLHSHAVLKRAFTAQHPTELTVKAGDVVEILTELPHGWTYVVDGNGYRGYVPTSYLEIRKDDDQKGLESPKIEKHVHCEEHH